MCKLSRPVCFPCRCEGSLSKSLAKPSADTVAIRDPGVALLSMGAGPTGGSGGLVVQMLGGSLAGDAARVRRVTAPSHENSLVFVPRGPSLEPQGTHSGRRWAVVGQVPWAQFPQS